MKISLEPADTFFFRDGKPFSRGEQTEATGIFPPFPATVYGALRTAYISEKGWKEFEEEDKSIKTVIGTKTSHGKFCVKGLFLERKGENEIIYFPLPRDLVTLKKMDNGESKTLHLNLRNDNFNSNSKTKQMLFSDRSDVEYPSGALLESGFLKSYLLTGASNGLQYRPLFQEDYLIHEPKVGIERDLNNPENIEGRLYRVNMMRLKTDAKYQILVDVENIDMPNSGILKFGGENRAFIYRKSAAEIFDYKDSEKEKVINAIEKTRQFKLYCATPAIWNCENDDEGWIADWMNGNEYNYKDIKCKLIAAVVGKPVNIGGWDIAKGEPKKMYRAIPAGSVYYLQLETGTGEDVFNAFHYRNISINRANEGLGLTLIGLI